jgi:hypothetical protein
MGFSLFINSQVYTKNLFDLSDSSFIGTLAPFFRQGHKVSH